MVALVRYLLIRYPCSTLLCNSMFKCMIKISKAAIFCFFKTRTPQWVDNLLIKFLHYRDRQSFILCMAVIAAAPTAAPPWVLHLDFPSHAFHKYVCRMLLFDFRTWKMQFILSICMCIYILNFYIYTLSIHMYGI